jgi:hypothetical protein
MLHRFGPEEHDAPVARRGALFADAAIVRIFHAPKKSAEQLRAGRRGKESEDSARSIRVNINE